MEGRSCRLFDDEVVRNIMVSTGMAVYDYLRVRETVNEEELCEFVEMNADIIIAETLREMGDIDEEGRGVG